MRRILSALALSVVCVMFACTNDNLYSTSYICRFMFRGDYHPTSLLARVLDNYGMFVKVTVQQKSGITHLIVNPNSGDADEDIALTTEIESRWDYSYVGANQCIFIGCTTTGEWKAFDGQCPYCLDNYGGTNYPLTWTNGGNSVECARCKHVYNLNYDGISPDDGTRMLQYRVSVNGSIISVGNG